MKRVLAGMMMLAIGGCATPGYDQYAAAIKQMAAQQAAAQIAAAEAIKVIAASGDTTAKAIAVLMLGLQSGQQRQVQMEPPRDNALQWASVILPSLTAVAGGYFGYRVAVTQSNNATTVANHSYDTIGGISLAGFNAISEFKPVPVDFAGLVKSLPPSTVETVNIGGDGVVQGGTINKPCGSTSTTGANGAIGC
jgi:hypothetical protein